MTAADPHPVLTEDRARAVQDAEASWFRRYLEVLGSFEDNRLGVDVRECSPGEPGCVATRCTAVPTDFFRNRLVGTHHIGEDRLAEVVADLHGWWTDAPGGRCRGSVDTVPGFGFDGMFETLHDAGFPAFGYMRQFWAPARDTTDELASLANRGVVVREIDPDPHGPDAAHWVRVFRAAEDDIHPVDGVSLEDFARAEFGLAADDQWTCFIAEIDGEPRAMAALHLKPDATVGSCSGAWTHPDGRRRGAQRALLLARMQRAFESGCELVLSQTGAGLENPSARNIQRAGLRIAWISQFWTMRKASE